MKPPSPAFLYPDRLGSIIFLASEEIPGRKQTRLKAGISALAGIFNNPTDQRIPLKENQCIARGDQTCTLPIEKSPQS